MNTALYEKEYFNDEYKEQFASLRRRFHDRTQDALHGRKTDKNPMPNATTIVYLHDEPDGGVSITTGDFVEYFNRRYGDQNRLGAMRKALAYAEKKAEASDEYAKRQRCEKVRRSKNSAGWQGRVRATRRPLSLANAFFALMLVFSLALLGTSAKLLERTEPTPHRLVVEESVTETASSKEALSLNEDYMETSSENTVEVFEVETSSESDGVMGLLSALGFWGK